MNDFFYTSSLITKHAGCISGYGGSLLQCDAPYVTLLVIYTQNTAIAIFNVIFVATLW